MLAVTRQELESYLTALDQTWREDESNLERRFARNRVRHELLPLLEREYNPSIRQVLSDAAEVARAEEEYWQALVGRELEERLQPRDRKIEYPQGLKPSSLIAGSGPAEAVPLLTVGPRRVPLFPSSTSGAAGRSERSGSADLQVRSPTPHIRHPESATAGEGSAFQTLSASGEGKARPNCASARMNLDNFPQLPLALQRRLLKRLLEKQRIPADFEHIESLLRCALGESPRAEFPGGWIASRTGERLQLLPPQPPRCYTDYSYTLPVPGEVYIAETGLTARCFPVSQEFAKEESPGSLLSVALLGRELTVRNWRAGDRFWPVHTKSEEKVKRLFSERHIPAERRQSWPLVLCNSQIVWVHGFPVAQAFAWSGSGRRGENRGARIRSRLRANSSLPILKDL